MKTIDPLKLHGYRVSRQRLDRVVEKLVAMTPDQRRELSPIMIDVPRSLFPVLAILQTTMQMLGVDELR